MTLKTGREVSPVWTRSDLPWTPPVGQDDGTAHDDLLIDVRPLLPTSCSAMSDAVHRTMSPLLVSPGILHTAPTSTLSAQPASSARLPAVARAIIQMAADRCIFELSADEHKKRIGPFDLSSNKWVALDCYHPMREADATSTITVHHASGQSTQRQQAYLPVDPHEHSSRDIGRSAHNGTLPALLDRQAADRVLWVKQMLSLGCLGCRL